MNLAGLFKPSSIAIVGASHDPKKVGHLVAQNIIKQKFTGKVFYVNNKYQTILGKKSYASLEEIKEPVDLVIFAVPAIVVLEYLEQMNKKGIKYAVVYAAGFKETGKDGQKSEDILTKKAKDYNLTLLGPNCIGYVNTYQNINATFLKSASTRGNISLVSQSGALGSLITDYFASHENLGLSYFVSLGNKVQIDESDVLEFLAQDNNTEVIGLYIEDIKNVEKFKLVLEKVGKIKPIVVIKSGTTAEGSKAAVSHTGALVGDDQVYNALFDKYHVIRAKNLTQFLAILKLFSFQKVPQDLPVLILSNAGGIGVLVVDELVKNKIPLLTISQRLKEKLEKEANLSKKVNFYNPIDLLGDASAFDFQEVIAATIREKQVGAIILLLTPQANTQITETAKVISAVEKQFDKPIYPIFMGEKSVQEAHAFFEKNKIVSFETYDFLPEALVKIVNYEKYRKQKPVGKLNSYLGLSLLANEGEISGFLNINYPVLNQERSLRILEKAGIPVAALHKVSDTSQAQTVAERLKYPVVAKINADKITHKTEARGVVVSIQNNDSLTQAFNDLTQRKEVSAKSCYLQKMYAGHELIVGAKRDRQFGIVLLLGLGSIYAELLKEAVYWLFPFGKDEFLRKLDNTKIQALINGFRGSAPVSPDQLYETVYKVGLILHKFKNISEIDINPLMISHGKIMAVDCRIICQ